MVNVVMIINVEMSTVSLMTFSAHRTLLVMSCVDCPLSVPYRRRFAHLVQGVLFPLASGCIPGLWWRLGWDRDRCY